MRTIKAFCFDVFGTVVDWRSGVAREVAPLLGGLRLSGLDPYEFADAWRSRYQPAMQACREGKRPFTRLDVLHEENLHAVLESHGVKLGDIDADTLSRLVRAWHRLDPWPDVVSGLSRLKTRYIIAPASNGNISLMTNLAKRAGLPWDVILGAEVTQAYKPLPAAYTRMVEVLGLAPSEVCMVAAHNSDLSAARQCGLATAFVPRPTEHGPGQTTDLRPTQDWDIIALDFNDLAAQAGCPSKAESRTDA
jgi:2-haloacid dehalogenase